MWFFVKLIGIVAAIAIGMTVYNELQWEREEYPGGMVCRIRKSGDQIVELKVYIDGKLVRHRYEGAGFSTHYKLYKDGELVDYYYND